MFDSSRPKYRNYAYLSTSVPKFSYASCTGIRYDTCTVLYLSTYSACSSRHFSERSIDALVVKAYSLVLEQVKIAVCISWSMENRLFPKYILYSLQKFLWVNCIIYLKRSFNLLIKWMLQGLSSWLWENGLSVNAAREFFLTLLTVSQRLYVTFSVAHTLPIFTTNLHAYTTF